MYLHIEVDKAFAVVGEDVVYTISIGNDEKETFKDICLVDYLPEEIVLVKDSIRIGERPILGDLQQGIQLGSVAVGEAISVKLTGHIEKIPQFHSLTNTVDIEYVVENKKDRVKSESNTVITLVTDPYISAESGGLLLSADKQTIDLGEEITYSVTVINKGNSAARNVVVSYLDHPYVTLKGQESAQPLLQIPILEVGEKQVITYQVVCTKLPSDFQVVHTVQLEYDFILANRQSIHKKYCSKPCHTHVETATFDHKLGGIRREVSTDKCTIGEVLTYHVQLTNKGNQVAHHLRYVETLPMGSEWVPDSLLLNGKVQTAQNLVEGLELGELEPEACMDLSYKIKVGENIPKENPIGQIGALYYDYQVGDKTIQALKHTPKVQTEVQAAILKNGQENGCFIQIDRKITSLEEKIDCNILLCNKGNKVAEKMSISVPIPPDVLWEGNGWLVDEKNAYIEYAQSMGPQDSCQIPFSLRVKSIPKTGQVQLMGTLAYSYTVGSHVLQKHEILRQPQPLEVVAAIISQEAQGVTKAVDKTIAQVGDMIHYTLWLTNTGNITAEQVVVQEEFPEELEVVCDGDNIQEGIMLGEIRAGEQKMVRYQAKVLAMEPHDYVRPISKITFEYPVGKERRIKSLLCDTVSTSIEMARIEGNVTVNKEYATLEDLLTYTFKLRNTGNVPAYDMEMILPEINGCRWENNVIYLDQLGVGEAVVRRGSLQVVSLPLEDKVTALMQARYKFHTGTGEEVKKHYTSHSIETPVITAQIKAIDGGILKSVDKKIATKGEELTYTLTLKNTGNITAQEVVIKEEIGEGLKLIPGTIVIDGKAHAQEAFALPIVLEQVKPSCPHKISYKVQVVDLPTHGEVKSITHMTYSYVVAGEQEAVKLIKEEVVSGATTIFDTKMSSLHGTLLQEVDQSVADLGDKLTYTITIVNTGNAVATSPYYQVNLGDGLSYSKGSLQVNGEMEKGELSRITLGDMPPEGVCHITFEAVVSHMPKEEVCIVEGKLNYKLYKPDGEGTPIVEGVPCSRTLIHTAGPLAQKDFWLSLDQSTASFGDTLTSKMVIVNAGNQKMKNIRLKLKEEVFYLLAQNPEGEVLGDLAPGESKEVAMQWEVVDTPQEPYIGPMAEVTYDYTIGDGIEKQGEGRSNEVLLKIQDTGFKKKNQVRLVGDKSYAELGEIISYEVYLGNSGNTSALNITAKIVLTDGLQIIPDTLAIAQSNKSYGEVRAVHIEKVQPGEEVRIGFKAQVMRISSGDEESAQMVITYGYKDANQKLQISTISTNEVVTTIRSVNLEGANFTKTLDKKEYTIGELIHYHMTCCNTGNITAKETRIKQSFPKGIVMLPETLKLQNGDRLRWKQSQEMVVGDILPGERKEIECDAKVEALIQEKEWLDLSSIVYQSEVVPKEAMREKVLPPLTSGVQIVSPYVAIQMSLEQTEVMLGDEVGIKLRLTNTGNQDARELHFEKLVPEQLVLVPQSIVIDHVAYQEITELSQLVVPSLAVGENLTVNFRVKVVAPVGGVKGTFIPQVEYRFELRKMPRQGSNQGSEMLLKVHQAQLGIKIHSDKEQVKVQLGETINYTTTLTNQGTLPVSQVIIYNELSRAMKFVAGYVIVKGKQIGIRQLEDGINIGYLEVGEALTIAYKAMVMAYYGKMMTHLVSAKYKFALDEESPLQLGETQQIEHQLQALSPYLTKIAERRTWVIPSYLPDIKTIEQIQTEVKAAGIRAIVEASQEVEVVIQLDYDISYRDAVGGVQKVKFEQLIMDKMQYSDKKLIQELPLHVEITQTQGGIINPRQLEIVLVMTVDL